MYFLGSGLLLLSMVVHISYTRGVQTFFPSRNRKKKKKKPSHLLAKTRAPHADQWEPLD